MPLRLRQGRPRAGAAQLAPGLAPAELAYQLDDAEPSLLMVEPGLSELGERSAEAASRPAPPRLGLDAAGLEALAGTGEAGRPVEVGTEVGDDDPIFLLYTSGTTGRPKGAVLTHANCFWTNLSLDHMIGLTGSDVVLSVLPQCHVGGWNVQPLLAWWKGARVVLEPTFDPGRCLRLISSERVSAMMGVPATYAFLAGAPGFVEADLSSLRLAVVGGAPMPEALLQTWRRRGVAISPRRRRHPRRERRARRRAGPRRAGGAGAERVRRLLEGPRRH
ncbi:MAG: AMP-binding protein [Acidimicrobiales bacterium]